MARKRGLTPEDRALWSKVTEGATPLHPDRRDHAAPIPDKPVKTRSAADHPHPQPLPAPGLTAFRIGEAARHKPATALPAPAMPLRMDHKTHRRMTQGKLRPEARLDLHGMTLAEAHPVLIAFLMESRARGLRLVLVITGKGRGDHGPLPTRPGALRHQLPIWLHQPPLATIVQQVTPAHDRHGGSGASYVYLRR